jgi:signal peptidase I
MTTSRSLERRGAFTLACGAALIIAMLIFWLASALAEPLPQPPGRILTIPNDSMLPTVQKGGSVLVLPTNQVQTGDVVTFYSPIGVIDTSVVFMKRIVGAGGDRIQMIDGVLNINGQAVKRERVEDYVPVEEGVPGKPIKRWRETLPNGVSYMTLDLVDNGFYDNTPVYHVPAGHFFMMGDNRDHSTDSRLFSQMGYVPVENIVGKVTAASGPWVRF